MTFKNIFLMNGSDAKNINKFREKIDIITVNANIAINNKKMISNTAQNYNIDLIIDPMTYMLQAGPSVLLKNGELRPSFSKVTEQIFNINPKKIDFSNENPMISHYKNLDSINDLCKSVFEFQEKYFEDLDDLGAFNVEKSKIKYISAPYFDVISKDYLDINEYILKSSYAFNFFRIIISEKTDLSLLPRLIQRLNESKIKQVEIWVEASKKNDFKRLVNYYFQDIKIPMYFKFVSFNEIYLLSTSSIKSRVAGFISAFGYGESRNVYPVGGGLPVNKIYSLIERKRVQVNDFFEDVYKLGINIENSDDGDKYLEFVCDCEICRDIIKNYGLPKILLFADFFEYKRKLKNGKTSKRIAASQEAITLTNYHYIDNKLQEYKDFERNDFSGARYSEWKKYNIFI